MKERRLVILALLIITAALAVGFVVWSNRNLPVQTTAKKQKAANLCLGLSADPEEISCEEAKNIALKEFPGEATGISRKQMDFTLTVGKKSLYDLWLITIQLDQSIKRQDGTVKNAVIVGVDVTDGRLKYSALQ